MEIRSLNTEEVSALNDALQMVSKFTSEQLPVSFSGLQRTYDDLLSWDKEYVELEISIGISFGQKFIETGRYEWVRVSDEYGEETVVSPKGFRTIISSISMLRKRLERNEAVKLKDFFRSVDSSIVEMIETGKYDKR